MKTVKLVWIGNGTKVATDYYIVVKHFVDGFAVSACINIEDGKYDELKDLEIGSEIEVPTASLR